MIYLFENHDNNASVVYSEETLTGEQKVKGIAIESLPKKQEIEGKFAILKCKKSTGEVWYDYEDEPKDEMVELKAKQKLMQQALDELILGGAL